ncbi:hypothetical protein DUK53_14645 [Listeria sp. SHR_NRA_18]|uniref:hypothetical protein n=1 Tax=Listeria TaxID=1637 RepID=UPI00051DCBB8|nr:MULTISPECIES: hypothetical protein [Listeria]KGL43739.1 hypothetical protein EP56_08020 [Listeriaceae bacterium FSL A5-0209]KMT61755.1 ATP-binding protein [Listeria newyorkensis]RQW65849.1 hypothetical protein DUK53_14645 [Listeria sp. SHR_NRA_18]
MYSLLVIFMGVTYQIFGIVIVTNVLAQKALSKKDIILITSIMALGGPILLSFIEYFSQIYTLGVLVLFLRWKGIRWLNALICVVAAQILLLIGNYIVGVFANNILGLSSQDYTTTIFDMMFAMIVFITPCLTIAYILALCIRGILRKNNFDNTVKYSEYVIVALLVLTIVIMYTLIHLDNVLGGHIEIAELYIFIFLALLFAMGIVLVIIAKVENARAEQIKQEQELAQLHDYMKKLETIYAQMSLFKHDYINILASLHGYIVKGDIGQLENYFNETIRPLSKFD